MIEQVLELQRARKKSDANFALKAVLATRYFKALFATEAEAAAHYEIVAAIKPYVALSLKEIVEKVKNTFSTFKYKAPDLAKEIEKAFHNDVVDIESFRSTLEELTKTLNIKEKKLSPDAKDAIHLMTVKNTDAAELAQLVDELSKTAFKEFKQMFDEPKGHLQYFWELLHKKILPVLPRMDAMLKSRFIVAVEKAGATQLRGIYQASTKGFTSTQLVKMGFLDIQTLTKVVEKVTNGTFVKDFGTVNAVLGVSEQVVQNAVDSMIATPAWIQLYAKTPRIVDLGTWLSGVGTLFLNALEKYAPVAEDRTYWLVRVTTLLTKYIEEAKLASAT